MFICLLNENLRRLHVLIPAHTAVCNSPGDLSRLALVVPSPLCVKTSGRERGEGIEGRGSAQAGRGRRRPGGRLAREGHQGDR